jgi:hypothetical protein
MAKKGEAGRALGAALMSSLVGALFGAGFLAISIPIVRPLVLAFGSPEMLMVILLGLTCISTLSGHGKRGLLLGLLSGGLGFLCSLVGQDRQEGHVLAVAERGRIGALNRRHLSFMGSITAPGRLQRDFLPRAARLLAEDGVDAALLVPV